MLGITKQRAIGSAALSQAVIVLFGLVLAHMAITLGLQTYHGINPENGVFRILFSRLSLFLPAFAVVMLLWNAYKLSRFARNGAPAKSLVGQIRIYLSDRSAVTESLVSLALIVLFLSNFSRFKGIIPQIKPFSWDESFAALDLALHGGTDPWQWLWPLLQHSTVIRSLDIAYFIWFLVVYFAIFMAIFGRAGATHRRAFLMGTVLVWGVGGNLVATVFSSAGPVFYHNLGLGAHYAALNDHLAQINAAQSLMAFQAKEIIWNGYAHGGDITSISAFPSIHVASTALVTLFAFTYARWLGWMMVAFTVVIFVGSIGLAWHYAADGYAGILLAYLSWRAGQWIAARA